MPIEKGKKALSAGVNAGKAVVENGREKVPNDAVSVLFISAILFTALTAYLITLAATGRTWAEDNFLIIMVVFYLFIDGFYALTTSLTYRHRVRVLEEAIEAGQAKIKRRYGEFVGVLFMLYIIVVEILTAFSVELPFGMLHFQEAPESMYLAIDVTVGILAASSIAKIWSIPQRPRPKHNNALLFLSFSTTVAFWVLTTYEAFGGADVNIEFLVTYSIILGSYVAHNMILALKCENYKQKKPGHLVAFAVLLFCAVIAVLYANFIATEFPSKLFAFGVITALLLAVGVNAPYFLEELIGHKKRREEKNVKQSKSTLNNDDCDDENDIYNNCPEL